MRQKLQKVQTRQANTNKYCKTCDLVSSTQNALKTWHKNNGGEGVEHR